MFKDRMMQSTEKLNDLETKIVVIVEHAKKLEDEPYYEEPSF